MGPEWVVVATVAVVVLLIATTGRRSSRSDRSTAGHYDPDAIGGYTLDPATMRYRHDLTTLPQPGTPASRGGRPPRRRRRRRRQTDAEGG